MQFLIQHTLSLLFCFHIFVLSAQKEVTPIQKRTIGTDHFVGVDNFLSLYTIHQNIFYKSWNHQTWQFGDYTLGPISKVSITNPLKILLFYHNLNTIVILDKYLNEIDRINFNTSINFKNPAFVSLANDKSIWLFDNNTQQLEIYDLETNETLFATLPVNGVPIDSHCNFNFCWILTKEKILQFNIYGNLLTEIENNYFEKIQIYRKGILVKTTNSIQYWSSSTKDFKILKLPKITVEHFYVTGEILYIYSNDTLYSYNLPDLLN